LFGDGTSSYVPDAEGLIWQGAGFYADALKLITYNPYSDVDRLCHACQLVTNNTTNCWGRSGCGATSSYYPYECVLQTNSWTAWGAIGTLTYDSGIDDLTFVFDLAVLQAQGNTGTQYSAGEAWAKNAVSIGGIKHFDSLDPNDHFWDEGASTGPATDGRVKPDLAHFFDAIYTTDARPGVSSQYVADFSGTSAATPIAAGMFGLFFQMWHEGVFSVCDGAGCAESGGECSVFDSRPHSMTAKAMMINTASPYSVSFHDIDRYNQGWGLPSIGRVYLLRKQFPIIIDEGVPLEDGEYVTYDVDVPANTLALRATLAYRDPPPASSSCNPCRINDLSLKVYRQPGGPFQCYLGNHGLLDGDWSSALATQSDCNPFTSSYRDTINTVENVFIQNPAEAGWTIMVRAIEVNEDGNVEYVNDDPSECVSEPNDCTEASDLDAVFSLVVSLDMDCNENNRSDADDILDSNPNTRSEDCNFDGIPDECQGTVECVIRGACCEAQGTCLSCRLMTEAACDQANGQYAGDDSLCTGHVCDPYRE
jgi:hypothetical protein